MAELEVITISFLLLKAYQKILNQSENEYCNRRKGIA